jgi:protein O-GlcNAc transferase
MEDVLKLDVPTTWLASLRVKVLEHYKSNILPPDHDKYVVTYLSRQNANFRRIDEGDHQALINELKKLEAEGLAEVNVEEFQDGTPIEEQVAKMARTTVNFNCKPVQGDLSAILADLLFIPGQQILISLHGNGLTHTLWMEPTPRSAVYEIQKPLMHMDDFSILAEAQGIAHWMVRENT